mmetsp:Transcript_11374/g.25882  ORF Transcript_11374/g.25882 Transcript_11374/m.25882 type:complete len:344 (-) Transcript_11374:9-1040(-)
MRARNGGQAKILRGPQHRPHVASHRVAYPPGKLLKGCQGPGRLAIQLLNGTHTILINVKAPPQILEIPVEFDRFTSPEKLPFGHDHIAVLVQKTPPGAYDIPVPLPEHLLEQGPAFCRSTLASNLGLLAVHSKLRWHSGTPETRRKAGWMITFGVKPSHFLPGHGPLVVLIQKPEKVDLVLLRVEFEPQGLTPCTEFIERQGEISVLVQLLKSLLYAPDAVDQLLEPTEQFTRFSVDHLQSDGPSSQGLKLLAELDHIAFDLVEHADLTELRKGDLPVPVHVHVVPPRREDAPMPPNHLLPQVGQEGVGVGGPRGQPALGPGGSLRWGPHQPGRLQAAAWACT